MKHPGYAFLGLMSTALAVAMAGPAQARELIIGAQCDRSGPTQVVGNYICDGAHDYFKLANKMKMFGEGNTVRAFEIDHGYNVPRGVEAYERTKEAGHVSYFLYGTPHTYALTPKLTADKVPGTSPGFGSAGAANGKSYPYVFPVAATYWSQAGAAVQFVMDEWKASSQAGLPKIAYLYYDNPAGREPLEVLRDIQGRVGFEMREFAAPPPGGGHAAPGARHRAQLQGRLGHQPHLRQGPRRLHQGAEPAALPDEPGDRSRVGGGRD